jgi:multiple sugar transport system ATP-binding protein
MSHLTIDNITKVYSVGRRSETAVEDVSLEIDEDEFVTLVGPSGCGKTTTLRCIAGLETPTSGRILYDGEDITEVPGNKRNLAMMFQDIALYPHMDAFDNIAYPLKIKNVPKSEQRELVEEAAEMLQIEELLENYPGEMSGGQQQRVALARTMVQDPRAFLMDEPLSDLDAKLQVEVRKEIQRVHSRIGKPTVYVTHNQEEAMTMSDRIAVMNDGHIEQFGTPRELYDFPENLFVARFIGNPSMNFFDVENCSLDATSGTVTLEGDQIQFDVGEFRASDPPSELVLGVRPISITLEPVTDGHNFVGEILLLEPIDDRAHATVDTDRGELIAQIPAETDLSVGDTVGISVETHNLYFFDPTSEKLIAKSVSERSSGRTQPDGPASNRP